MELNTRTHIIRLLPLVRFVCTFARMPWLSDGVRSGDPEAVQMALRLTYNFLFATVANVVLVAFAIVAVIREQYMFLWLLVFQFCAIAISSLSVRFTGSVRLAEQTNVFTYMLFLIGSGIVMFSSGEFLFLFYGVLFIPVVFYLEGPKWGSIWILIFLLLSLLSYWIYLLLGGQPVPSDLMMHATGLMTITFMFVGIIELMRFTYMNMIESMSTRLKVAAVSDQLTGLYNRRRLDEGLATEVERSLRYGHPVTVALIDLDHFKTINDTRGHPAGDQMLMAIAEVLKGRVRITDQVGRWGGEEFLLVLAETEIEGARRLCEQLRLRIAELEPLPGMRVTASFGIATHRSGESREQLVSRADRALYRAKDQGRNRVEILP